MGEPIRKSKKFQPALNDRLEDRTVPSHMGLGGFFTSQVASFHGGFGQRGGFLAGRTSAGTVAATSAGSPCRAAAARRAP